MNLSKSNLKQKFEDFYYELRYNKYVYFVQDIVQGLTNLVEYAIIIWKDRDWDHRYLFELMAFKLKRMEKHFIEHDIHTNHLEVSHRVKVSRVLLDRLIKDEYWTTDEIIKDCNCDNPHEFIPEGKYFRLKGHTESCSKRIQRLGKHEEYLKQQDLQLFCRYFSKYSRGWWC